MFPQHNLKILYGITFCLNLSLESSTFYLYACFNRCVAAFLESLLGEKQKQINCCNNIQHVFIFNIILLENID